MKLILTAVYSGNCYSYLHRWIPVPVCIIEPVDYCKLYDLPFSHLGVSIFH